MGAYSDYRKENTDGAENGLRWGDTRNPLREIRSLYGHVQRGENPALPFRSLGIGIHDLSLVKGSHERET